MAARAAECAGDQGRFAGFHRLLYDQATLNDVDWSAIADLAGVADSRAFAECLNSSSPVPAIERDMKALEQLAGVSTPTILIDSLLLATVPDSVELDAIIRRILDDH